MSAARRDGFGILFVCTGNVCRSAIAEILTRRLLRDRLGAVAADFSVASAGTESIAGAKMDSRSAAILARYGLGGAAAGFRARRLDTAMVCAADLVLTAEREHRRAVVTLEPSALRKAFCLREWGRLLGGIAERDLPGDCVARARVSVELAVQQRGSVPYTPAEADAIPDPVRYPPHRHRASIDLIAAEVRNFAEFLQR
ncbi:arsenate reductase/protein-tyrosine-phosphatase family protein [Amycolatopsis alkalitolerans]|uniref:Protein-tyrosine-phosphatase n=1 Tax=Amycolatopsis alkalitolerans TaxID=2547244 RepID=A0A5C4LSD5_9PSEU|nr:protein-tyrosine-phosphatase [Amycolatopsis alkalitolerans]TNC21881.1 protein-tyrosine-phosphatase [Amycolatopsis alkalitolerans]